MKKLVIDRKQWIRGNDPGESCLLRDSDKKMCCLGFYLRSLHVEPGRLRDVISPAEMDLVSSARTELVPQGGQWLLTSNNSNSPSCRSLMGTNDRLAGITEAAREKRIAATFAKHGVKVEFR